MDEITDKAFYDALKQLADKSDLSDGSRDALDSILDLVPPRRPREAFAEQDDRQPEDDDFSDTLSFAPVPTDRNKPPTLNPFRRDHNLRPDTPTSSPRPGDKLGRFINLGLIGRGGMGEVYRVRDPDLQRQLVVKVLRTDWIDDDFSIARFLEEARLTSQLHHPGIVPVHELGTLDDGRYFFSMREVRGRTLREVIDEYHDGFNADDADERAWHAHFYSLIEIFSRVCEPVAYAHSRGVIHRDLKPSNIMIGDFGEVQILDWGLGKFVDKPTKIIDNQEAISDPSSAVDMPSRNDTLRGSIVGTPAFMPPEQARGHHDALGPAADVYALGAILYVLLEGSLPFSGNNAATILINVIEGVDGEPGRRLGAPPDLIELCLRAMSLDPDDRPANAAELDRAITAWREGSTRQEEAFQLIERADDLFPELKTLRDRAQRLRRRSRQMLREVSRSAPVQVKRPAWSLRQEADLLEREASKHRATIVQWLETALTYVPGLEPAHERLAELYRRDHAEAELQRDLNRADSLEVFLRAHNTGKFDEYLAGMGTLTLRTRPAGARVNISRYIKQDYRIVPGLKRTLGHTPLVDTSLPMGSYLLELSASQRTTVRYPVLISRQGCWTGAPSDWQPYDVPLPFADEIESNEIYVPASSFWRGGDSLAFNGAPRSVVWVDPFIIQKFSVRHAEYLEFLNDLVDQGLVEKAVQHAPKNAGNISFNEGNLIYSRDDQGYFLPRDEIDDFLRLPVSLITWHSARAYARWYSSKTAKSWRLPTSNEWEKAARGVDGRFFPWGDTLDPTWCRMLHSTQTKPEPVPVDSYPDDESPYGMRGAAGNIRNWCAPDDHSDLDAVTDDEPMPVRGGCWFSTPEMCRLASREFSPSKARSPGTGFRLVRGLY